jgi:predicted MFS family arabinose efflux permease
VGGGLYYNVTMPIAARLFPERRATAFSVLTFIGAFASPIFFPATSAMLDEWGWRTTVRTLAVIMAVLVLLAVRAPTGAAQADASHERRTGLVAALRSLPVAGTIATFAIVGMASSAVVVHQVPAVQAAGLSLAAASGLAGARGLLQIPGRLVLTPITRWWGTGGALAVSYVVAAVGAWALFAAGPVVLVYVFVAASGLSLGIILPLQGIFAAEVYPGEHLGTVTSVQQVAGSIAGAAGPWLTGLAVEATDSYQLALGVIGSMQLAALVAIVWLDRARALGSPARADV